MRSHPFATRAGPALRLLALTLFCCAVIPRVTAATEPPDATPIGDVVAAALNGDAPVSNAQVTVLFEFPEPTRLRPCCAFGLDLKVDVGPIPVPWFSMETVRGLEDVGMHEYGAGLVQIAPPLVAPQPERPWRENNGIVYTCRGGFLDTAHVRDYSDLTAYLAAQISRSLETGGVIDLADQGGKRRVVLRPVDAQRIAQAGRIPLSVAIAQWLTFELSVWREIATWYGHESVPPWPETISSFSPEDLYSNLLGTKIAGGILLAQTIRSELEYDRAMSDWLPAALKYLEVAAKPSAAAAMKAVDGIWWDSKTRVPDWKLVRRRKLDLDSPLGPWLVEMADTPRAEVGCAGADPAVELHLVDSFGGVRIADHAEVELIVGDRLAGKGFPFLRAGDRRVTHADFSSIVEYIRRQIETELEAPSDHPKHGDWKRTSLRGP